MDILFRFRAFARSRLDSSMLALNTCNAAAISAISSEPVVTTRRQVAQATDFMLTEDDKAAYDPTANKASRSRARWQG